MTAKTTGILVQRYVQRWVLVGSDRADYRAVHLRAEAFASGYAYSDAL